MSSHTATDLARDVVRRLLDAGVEEVVVAPGSRNAPLSFAVHDAAAAGRLRLHTRVDERSAGFLAVGLARSHRPTAVVCTSGTAVANLHPAALEATHVGLPVAFVTADRPARLRGTDANQTTDQVGVLGPLLATRDLDAPGPLDLPLRSDGRLAGPVHLNVQLDEPLLPDGPWVLDPAPERAPSTATARREPPPATELVRGPRTVVVAGDDAGPAARRLAERSGWPLLAEPSSGARTGAAALRCYRLLLATDLGAAVERVVVLGRPTLSRPVSRLLARDDVEVHEVTATGAWSARPYPVTSSAPAFALTGSGEGEQPDDPAWAAAWHEADRAVGRRLDALLAAEADLTPYEVAGTVHAALDPGMQLVVGASSPIRDLDLVARPTPVGERRKVVANRGLAGIDGTVSTAIGAALGRPEGPTLALLGDVTFLHDSNGLVLGPHEPRPDLVVVVANDDGGAIFSMLEQGAEHGHPEHGARFEALFGTPHGVDLASLCAATRTPHTRVDSLPELQQVLRSPNGGIEVVEARVRRDGRRALDERIRALRP
ncbi:2-succinyl-5-enolpyruvyl-6-hydroxy-3-cyclohexene-1-carboxylic-acid synthase [Nocardioides litoris]|uniref:2-succinyl-5-enolpyruvyl-6-hydroxy-3- cyclohexene-1-carboxylic-acid synthase n=1 Tax=Nocardioides litoris TaxID=1926648 RepID=UPI0011232AD3|nr:2-succinyl-5-enolpyruvyl-6-hydroxy-3-cyclohexene-1-carboxylic-acid synthase [Nocardioides litoris]